VLVPVAALTLPAELAYEHVAKDFATDELWRPLALSTLVDLLTAPLLSAAAIFAAHADAEGRPLSAGEVLRGAFSSWMRVLGVQLLAGLLAGLGFVAFVIPGIVIMARLALVDVVAVVERRRVTRCLDRSRALVKGATGRVLVVLLLVWLPVIATAAAGGFAAELLPSGGAWLAAASGTVDNLALTFSYVGLFALYATRLADEATAPSPDAPVVALPERLA
jgi:hypothetical protein